MTFETIIFSNHEGVARLRLNRPAQLNAFNLKMHEEVRQVLDELELARNLRVLLITGEGRAFCSGQDLNERHREAGEPPPDLSEGMERRWGPLVRRLGRLPAPIVCGVNGVAAGAGANIAFACDLVIASKSARFVQSFVSIGLSPDAGGTWILPRIAGHVRAMGLALTAEPLRAETAADWGVIWKAVDDDRFADEIEAVVAKLAALPPLALAAVKRAMRASANATLEQQLDLERDLVRQLGLSEDYAEGVRAFLEKRPPRFTGR